jgi:release factor glutamine methyltransferase
MTTILDALQKGTGYLEKHGVESARLNMQHLLATVLGCRRMDLYVNFDKVLEEARLERLRDLMKRRAQGVPLQHLAGTVEFLGHEFSCDERALIPRPETEELVGVLLKRAWVEKARILDMGCGSGVIGLSLAAHLAARGVEVVLADLSRLALDLARENAARLVQKLEGADLRFVEGDLFAAVSGEFDAIVANLPYLSVQDLAQVSREVRHDPEMALVGGERGTELMERFLGECPARLRPGGMVAMEFGAGQEELLREVALSRGLRDISILRDLQGMPRFLLASAP